MQVEPAADGNTQEPPPASPPSPEKGEDGGEDRGGADGNATLLKQVLAKFEADAEAKEGELAEQKNASLLLNGVTIGVAPVLHGRFFKIADAQQRAPSDLSAMPYIAVLPSYWRTPEATDQACAASWGGGSEKVADRAATSAAKRKAEEVYPAVARRVAGVTSLSQQGKEELTKQLGLEKSLWCGRDERPSCEFIVEEVRKAEAELDSKKKEAQRARVIGIMADSIWLPGLSASCARKKFGLYVGFPLDYSASYRIEDKGRESLKVNALVSAGLAVVPNKYLSLLLGLTIGQVRYAAAPANGEMMPDEETRPSVAFTVGLGGNIDIITQLVKALSN